MLLGGILQLYCSFHHRGTVEEQEAESYGYGQGKAVGVSLAAHKLQPYL